MRKGLFAVVILWMSVTGAAGLAAQDTIRLDAVSIKENRSGAEQGTLSIPRGGNRILVTNSPMFRIIGFAFNKQRNDLIVGLPDWTQDARWNLEATIAEESLDAFRHMPFEKQTEVLQQILRDRCGLVAHTGKREAPVYALTVAKSKPKLAEVSREREEEATNQGWDLTQSAGRIEGRAVPIDALLYALSKVGLERQVVNRTGLLGRYDFVLTWAPNGGLMGSESAGAEANMATASLFTALQEQLGLKLEATKAEVDAVIVTHIERPSAN
jgi:uncharacterized protein (TIGR03435 family)